MLETYFPLSTSRKELYTPLVDSGHMTSTFMQVPGLSNEEMPQENSKIGFEVIELNSSSVTSDSYFPDLQYRKMR